MEHQSVNAFSRQEFNTGHLGNPHRQQLEFNMGGFKPPQNTFARDMDTSHVSRAQVAMSTGSQIDTGRNTHSSNIQAMMLQSGVNQAHMEIMHKQQVLKETCDLPFIFLSDSDEKDLFDLAVALKFGNQQTIFQSCQRLDTLMLHDFPPEFFLQRSDILKALLDLLEGGGAGQA